MFVRYNSDMSTNETEELLTADEAASILKIRPGALRRLANQDKVPSITLGHKTVRFRRSDIERICREGLK